MNKLKKQQYEMWRRAMKQYVRELHAGTVIDTASVWRKLQQEKYDYIGTPSPTINWVRARLLDRDFRAYLDDCTDSRGNSRSVLRFVRIDHDVWRKLQQRIQGRATRR